MNNPSSPATAIVVPPLLIPAVALTLGIAGGTVAFRSGASPSALSIAGGAAIFLAIIIISILYRRGMSAVQMWRMRNLHPVWISILFLGIGILDISLNLPYRPKGDVFPATTVAHGRVREMDATTSGDRMVVDVLSLSDNAGHSIRPQNLRVIINTDATLLEPDDEILFIPSFSRITDSPNHFASGYASMLEDKGILYSARIPSDSIIHVGHSATLKGTAHRVRLHLEKWVEESPLNPGTRHFLTSILLGDRDYLHQSTRTLFVAGGVAHILALSGMHVGIIASIILFLLFPLSLAWQRKARPVIAMILVGGYTFITGMAFSTVRAFIMLAAFFIGMLLQRKNSAWNSLLFAITVIILFSPEAVLDPGFQLSIICVGALIAFAEQLNPIHHRTHPRLWRAAGILLASLTATAATWPLASYRFGSFPLHFLPANLLILPILPLFLIIALAALILGDGNIVGAFLCRLTDLCYDSAIAFLDKLTEGGSASIPTPSGPVTVALWIAGLILLALAIRMKKGKRRIAITSSGAILLIFSLITLAAPSGTDLPSAIIQNYHHRISLALPSPDGEETVTMPPGEFSILNVSGKRIIAADTPFDGPLSLMGWGIPEASGDTANKCDILIIGRGMTGDPLPAINYFQPGEIAIHPSVRKKKEREIIAICDSLGIRTHSLRESPLHLPPQ